MEFFLNKLQIYKMKGLKILAILCLSMLVLTQSQAPQQTASPNAQNAPKTLANLENSKSSENQLNPQIINLGSQNVIDTPISVKQTPMIPPPGSPNIRRQLYIPQSQNPTKPQQPTIGSNNKREFILQNIEIRDSDQIVYRNKIPIPMEIVTTNKVQNTDAKVAVKVNEQPQVPQEKAMPKPVRQRVRPTNVTKSQFYCGNLYANRPRNYNPPQPQGAREKVVRTAYGFDMYIDPKDSTVSMIIQSSGTWEPEYINLMGHIVNPGDYVLNLGSQTGLQALVMGKIIGPEGRLFIFEPYSVSNALVTKNVELNQLQNITTIYKLGASDQKSTSVIQVDFSNTGGSQINTDVKQLEGNKTIVSTPYGERQVVQLDKVDNVLPTDVALDFALLDVERMEVKALRGMKQVISRSPNLIVMCEWQYTLNQKRNRQQTVELLNFFVEKGYGIYSYPNRGNIQACTIGKFYQYVNIEQILSLPFIDLFFIPKNHPILKA